jgi:hypothetical protein
VPEGAGAAPPPLGGFATPDPPEPEPDERGTSPPAPATRLLPPVLAGGRATPPLPAGVGVGPTGRGPLGRTPLVPVLAPPVPPTPEGGRGTADATGLASLVAPVVVAGLGVGCAMMKILRSP